MVIKIVDNSEKEILCKLHVNHGYNVNTMGLSSW